MSAEMTLGDFVEVVATLGKAQKRASVSRKQTPTTGISAKGEVTGHDRHSPE